MFEHVNGGRREKRREALPAAGVAVLLHLLLIGLVFWGVREEIFRAGEPVGDGLVLGEMVGGGGGGGGAGGQELVSYVDIAPAPEEPAPEPEPEPEEDVLIPPEPEPVVEPPRPQPAPTAGERPAVPAPLPGAGTGGGTGGGVGAGEGPGTGPGQGPGSGGGSGGGDGGGIGTGQGPGGGRGESRIRPPQSDVLLIPPDRPSGVASQELTVILRIDTRGRVRDARLAASTGNRGYDDRIRRWATGLVFRPAVNLDTNQPVEAEYSIEIAV
jgi:hypothetical protein